MANWINKFSTRFSLKAGASRGGRRLGRASFATMALTVFFFSIVLGAAETSGTILISSGSVALGDNHEGNFYSGYVTASADGGFAVFDSRADNIMDADMAHSTCISQHVNVNCFDILVYDRAYKDHYYYEKPDNQIPHPRNSLPEEMHYLISRQYNAATLPVNGDARFPIISRDGRFVVFQYKDDINSQDYDLVPSPLDSNGKMDIFIYDLDCISDGDGFIYQDYFRKVGYAPVDQETGDPITYDCGSVGINNQSIDIVSKVDMSDPTVQPNADSGNSLNDPYQRYAIYVDPDFKSPVVLFESNASNLVSNDTNGHTDIFLRKFALKESETHDVICLTCFVPGTSTIPPTTTNGASTKPVVSGDGNWVTFVSDATNLIPGVGNGKKQVYLLNRDLPNSGSTPTIKLISKNNSTGAPGNEDSDYPTMSKDGSRIAFSSSATNLVAGDGTPNYMDIFLVDSSNGNITRESLDSNGVMANGDSYHPNLSANGGALAFSSDADNLVDGDNNVNCRLDAYPHIIDVNCGDVFVRDVRLHETWRASITSNGLQARSDLALPFLAGENEVLSGGTENNEGKFIFFSSRGQLDQEGEASAAQQVFYRNQGTPAGNPNVQPTYWTFYGYAMPASIQESEKYKYGTSKKFTVRFLGPLTLSSGIGNSITAVTTVNSDPQHREHFFILDSTSSNKCQSNTPYQAGDSCEFTIKYVPYSADDHDYGRITIPVSDDRQSINIAMEGWGRIFEYMPMIAQEGF